MLDLDASRGLRWLFYVARTRVTVGFLVAGVAVWLARPTWISLGSGASIAVAGEVLRVWAAGHLRKGREITRSGPYRYVGHPLYVGSFIMGLGFAVAAGHPFGAGLVVAYLAVTLFAAIRWEEATLRETFGEEFDQYTRGRATFSDRRFSIRQVTVNGEHRALLGFAATLAVLSLKAWRLYLCQ